MWNDHPDKNKLHLIARAIERKNGVLPSVRKDSPAWDAWRTWFRERGMPTRWSDGQPDDRMMTVVLEYPPLDIDETFNRWVKSGGKKTELE